MPRSRFTHSILWGCLLLTSLLLWFAVVNYRNAEPVAQSILRGMSLSLGQAIEALAVRDPSLKTLAGFSSVDSAYFSLIDKAGVIRFHKNTDLIGSRIEDQRYLAVAAAPVITEERVRLGTGEVVFETQQQLHLPGETMVLRLALHTWQADQIIRRARTGLVVIVVLLALTWGFGVWVLRLQLRDLRRREEMARHEQLVRLGELGAVLAHEVRTPLAGIKGFAQLLRERVQDVRQQEYAGKIVTESERLEGLVTDLLTYARQETLLEGDSVLTEVLQDAWEHLATEAAQAGVTLQVVGAIARPVACPPDRLRQMLLNLFTNAIQAMPVGGVILINLSDDGDRATILISDSGPGFAEETLKRALDPFYTTRASGSGLGLAVCHKIASGYGGTVVLANGCSGGAEVALLLPLIKEHA